ncbi:hypothetical protein RRG08_004469 [Elysia crispata]|uniref:Protein Abitram n=1 Tax=Elysia crispata TaxID=231223 RepID=A0AAE1B9A9_9GAST|nr:hypothetical protein RRG08_004469 [Elysia crispata]
MEESRPPSVVDRYFQKRYKTDVQGNPGEDQLILTHSNRICVICIAQSHPIICEKKIISKINFQGDGWSRLENTVTGKNKRGAQWLERMAPLCCVTCTDGSVFTLCCCVKGQLVEINTNLETRPSLLTEKSSSNGYLAVILPGLKHFNREVERLKSEEEYRKVLEYRSNKSAFQNLETPQPCGINITSLPLDAVVPEQRVTEQNKCDLQGKQEDNDETMLRDGSLCHNIKKASEVNSL